MTMLTFGIVLWWVVHLFPAAAPSAREDLLERLGALYRGIFVLLTAGALALIVFGWQGSDPVAVYVEPSWGRMANMVLMLVALILFAGAVLESNIKRFIRHPQLTAVVVWATGHLLANGDSRSVLTFGAFAVWAIIEIVLINRRDGAWRRPDAVSSSRDLIPLIVGVALYFVLLFAHPWIAGVAVY